MTHVHTSPGSAIADNGRFCSVRATHVQDKLLRYDHTERITSDEAMQHAYFAPVRANQEAQAGGR